ncbi:hypothetical protein NFI96_031578, partial [Prochilodus magdalenae]
VAIRETEPESQRDRGTEQASSSSTHTDLVTLAERREAGLTDRLGNSRGIAWLACAEEDLNMGTSESKMAVVSTPKPKPGHAVQNRLLAQLVDPRSPSCGIDRTPIQVAGAASHVPEVQESVGPLCVDPRSPTQGVARTPMKDSMKVTVSSLARKLSTFFLSDSGAADSSTPLPHVSFTKHPSMPSVEQQDEQEEPSSKDPLLPSQDPQNFLRPPSPCKVAPSSPVACSPSVGYGSFSSSPFVLVGEVEVDTEVDAEVTLEEAEEALYLGESMLQRELSLSLLGCREGVYPPEFYRSAEERPPTPLPPPKDKQHSDHSYSVALVSCEPVQPSSPAQRDVSPPPSTAQPPEQEEAPAVPEQEAVQPEKPNLVAPEPVSVSSKPSLTLNAQREVPPSGIMIPRFDTQSPSQAVFKPQWLGVGFGATGVRARGVQGRGKATSSPLSTRKPAIDENKNKVVLTKQKPRGKALLAEGRSPLQVLKEANSPRDHPAQVCSPFLPLVHHLGSDEAEGFNSREEEVWPDGQKSTRPLSQQRESLREREPD